MTGTAAEAVLDVGAEHAEAPVWDSATEMLRFVDITTGRVFAYDLHRSPLSCRIGRHVSDVHPTTSGDILVATREGVALLSEDQGLTMLCAPLADRPGMRMNDGNADPQGRYLIGSMAYDQTQGAGSLYRIDGSGHANTVLTDVTISNGIDWSPDGTRAYYVDSATHGIDLFDYDLATGEFSGRRRLIDIDPDLGLPDGLTVDAEGRVWVAIFGGGRVLCFAPSGDTEAEILVPGAQLVTSCCFGGPSLDQLYVTTSTEALRPADLGEQPAAGYIFRADPGARGQTATPVAIQAGWKVATSHA